MDQKLTVLYDAECSLCCQTVAALEKLRARTRLNGELSMVSLQEAREEDLPFGVSKDQLLSELHVVDGTGKVYKGADGIIEIMKTIPSLVWIARVYRIPGMRGMAAKLYRWMARYRYRLFGKQGSCSTGSCRINRPPSDVFSDLKRH